MKNKETLEEVAFNAGEKEFKEFRKDILEASRFDFVCGFTAGAKWQQQQDKNKYSEEDLDAFRKFMIQEQNFSKSCLDVFVEQLKNK